MGTFEGLMWPAVVVVTGSAYSSYNETTTIFTELRLEISFGTRKSLGLF